MGYTLSLSSLGIPLDDTGSGSGGAPTIPEYQDTDPVSPQPEDVWVKHTNTSGGGDPIGLLLALTYAGSGAEKYELSYRTLANTTVRVELT